MSDGSTLLANVRLTRVAISQLEFCFSNCVGALMKLCWTVLLCFATLGGASGLGAQAPEANLDATKRKLDAAKQAQAEQARMATLVLRSDADCRLSINGEDQGVLNAGQVKAVKLIPGEQLVDCTSTEFDSARLSTVKTATVGTQSVVMLELAASVSVERAAREAAQREAAERERLAAEQSRQGEERQAEEQQRQAAAIEKRRAALQVRFVAKRGTVRDKETGLVWAARDNGSDINWNQARGYCAGLRGKWELPTVLELQGLYDPTAILTQSCSSSTCEVTPLIRLSSFWFWSQQSIDTLQAWSVYLDSGRRYSGLIGDATDQRALCVQRS